LATINEIQSVGSGYYNGMVASLRTANYHGLLAKLNYTYGHARDDLSATRGAIPQNNDNIRGDYGNADFDIRHSFVGFVSYSLPTPSHAKLLLGGWQLNSSLSFYTGTPFTVYSGTNTNGTKENKDRAEVTGDPYQNVPASNNPITSIGSTRLPSLSRSLERTRTRLAISSTALRRARSISRCSKTLR